MTGLLRHLRSHRVGLLLADGVPIPLRFVTDPASGAIIAPVPGAVGEAEELVLWVPEESDDALQLLVAASPTDPGADAACDRWLIYHGKPRERQWFRFTIETARLGGRVLGGELFMRPNELAAAESTLCKRLNADRARLAALCRRSVGFSPAEPVAVGVDPDGLDIRASAGVVRLDFPNPLTTVAEVESHLSDALGEGRP